MMLDQINYLAELSHQGYRLLTPNQRLASYLTQTINSQQANKACVWETVSAQSYDDFLSAVYKQFLAKNLKAPKTVLDSCSETWLWEQAIEQIESESGHIGLLNKQGAAQEAMRSYRLLLNWNVSISDHDFVLNAHRDSRQFLIWAERFELLLKQKNVLQRSLSRSLIL